MNADEFLDCTRQLVVTKENEQAIVAAIKELLYRIDERMFDSDSETDSSDCSCSLGSYDGGVASEDSDEVESPRRKQPGYVVRRRITARERRRLPKQV